MCHSVSTSTATTSSTYNPPYTTLGLLGFSIASLLCGFLKIIPQNTFSDPVFASAAFFLGGVAQLITCLISVQSDAHTGATFGIYGLHWMCVGVTCLFPQDRSLHVTVAYDVVLALVTFVLWIPTLRIHLILNLTLVLLFLVFVLDIPALYGVRGAQIGAGVFQCSAGLMGLYAALAEMVNERWERVVLPIGHVRTEDELDSYAFGEIRVWRKEGEELHL